MAEEENVRRSQNPRLNLEAILCRMAWLEPLIPIDDGPLPDGGVGAASRRRWCAAGGGRAVKRPGLGRPRVKREAGGDAGRMRRERTEVRRKRRFETGPTIGTVRLRRKRCRSSRPAGGALPLRRTPLHRPGGCPRNTRSTGPAAPRRRKAGGRISRTS